MEGYFGSFCALRQVHYNQSEALQWSLHLSCKSWYPTHCNICLELFSDWSWSKFLSWCHCTNLLCKTFCLIIHECGSLLCFFFASFNPQHYQCIGSISHRNQDCLCLTLQGLILQLLLCPFTGELHLFYTSMCLKILGNTPGKKSCIKPLVAPEEVVSILMNCLKWSLSDYKFECKNLGMCS